MRDTIARPMSSARRYQALQTATGLRALDAAAFDFAGCYQLSADTADARPPIPARLALDRVGGRVGGGASGGGTAGGSSAVSGASGAGAARDVVHAIDAEGRVETPLIGTWRQVDATTAVLTLNTAGSGRVVILTRGSRGLTARLGAVEGTGVAEPRVTQTVRVVRVECRA